MDWFNDILTTLVFVMVFLPSLFLFLELTFGLIHSNVRREEGEVKPYRIIIPAHNEAEIIKPTLAKLKAELGCLSHVVVIADNCTDDTADLAREQGAFVVERHHATLKGKGYALDAGIQAVSDSAPDTVVVFDADCEFTEGSCKQLILKSQRTDSVVQSLYLMKAPIQAPVKTRIAEFAWLVKNLVRPLGLSKFGINCQLQGSGMAFPWRVFEKVSFASGSIVEDLELGIKLNNLDENITFDVSSQVISFFPSSGQGSETQRMRWEHGHMASIAILPSAMLSALKRGRLKSCFTALDAMIPPTVLWLMLVVFTNLVTACLSIFLEIDSFLVAVLSLTLILLGLALAWLRYGLSIITPQDIASVIVYIFSKFDIYKKFLGNRQKDWVRTDRGNKS
ncbi:glycosyltransferase [Vibrio aquaticus]|uniref:Glycosyltransferase n=1 Tax=Vibrio aquaticus TaxID=2496559 RepID=A0A432D0M7_9VIBR|nr:glycosyltransferase family 2 protein [Vibrio aquaticus]RTZ17425.1 glycosyltransferase [Vibrio aquaticus]